MAHLVALGLEIAGVEVRLGHDGGESFDDSLADLLASGVDLVQELDASRHSSREPSVWRLIPHADFPPTSLPSSLHHLPKLSYRCDLVEARFFRVR